MRLVLDTDVMVAAIRSDRGASRHLLIRALEKHGVTLLLSVPLVIEYEAVMTRTSHLRASGLSEVEVTALLDAVAAVSEKIDLAFLWRPTLPDVADDMVLETAVNGRADAIVTFNRRHFAPIQKGFGISVLLPTRRLDRIAKEIA